MILKKNILLFFIFLLFLFTNNIFFSEEEKKILILNSYHIGYEWSDSEQDGVQSTLKKAYENLNLYIEYLDRKRFSYIDENEYFQILKEQFKKKYSKIDFDGIITIDNAAFNFVLKYQNILFPGIPIIFCGVNYFEDKMIEGYKNITGVVEFVDFKSAIDVILEVQPEVENIYIINDLTLSSRINRQIISDIVAKYYIGKVNFIFIDKDNSGLSFEELLSKLAKLKKDEAVFFADFYLDKNKKAYSSKDVFPKIAEASKAPIYDNDDTGLGYGIIGGKLNSGYYHGQTAADLLIEVFNGRSIEDIPVVKKAINRYMFDYKQLKRFDIKPSRLPQNSIIKNRPTVFYIVYAKELIIGLLITIIFIIFIIILSTSILRRKVAESSLGNLFESLPDMVKIIDSEGKYLYVNEVTCKTLGYTYEEMMKMSHKNIEDLSFLNEFYKKNHLEYNENSFEGVYISKNKEKIPVDINKIYIKFHRKVAVLIVARNISERKKAEKEREDLLKKLALKNEELESIIYAASHDLKTPIINILGFGKELLLSSQEIKDLLNKSNNNIGELKKDLYKVLNKDITQSVKFITESSLKMEQLLNGLLKVSRLGRVQLEVSTIDMNNLVKSIIDSMNFKIKETKAFITCAKLPKCIGDISQINRVFTNLIDNSLKYLNPKKKALIKISGRKKDKMSIYCIEDNGIGVPKDKKEKVFEIFYRFDSSINPKGEGIGLTIVKKIVEQHNGNIWIDSEEGKGSKFYISLPFS